MSGSGDVKQLPTKYEAIAAALAKNWKEATRINSVLTKQNPHDIDALNRLGFAYLNIGQITQAKRCFSKVISIDPYNQIALRNIKKLGSLKKYDLSNKRTGTNMSPLAFLEDPGKTKIVTCVNPAPIRVLSRLASGLEVVLKAKRHAVEVRDDRGAYLAALPDDISFKLIKYLGAGNTYSVIVKSVGKNALTIFIREVSRGKRFANQPSFAAIATYLPSTPLEAKQDDENAIAIVDEDEESIHDTHAEPSV